MKNTYLYKSVRRITLCLSALILWSVLAVTQTIFGASVLIVGTDTPTSVSGLEDVQLKITATNLFTDVDIFDAYHATPTLDQLKAYDAVLTFSRYRYYDGIALGNILADYVDVGGGVVQATFAFNNIDWGIHGRWDTAGYNLWKLGANNSGTDLTLGMIHETDHPILDGVTTFDGGSSSFHNAVGALNAGAVAIADWSNGVPLIAENTTSFTGCVAGLNFHPVSSDAEVGRWDASTDGALLMANALLHCGGVDADDDGIIDGSDNCPNTPNSDQNNNDGDSEGDACDADDDNDTVLDTVDNCPFVAPEDQADYENQADYDNDGEGDLCDMDDDGDNKNDSFDECLETALDTAVNALGCSIEQLCPCDNEWKNHGGFMKCVTHAASDFRDAGIIFDSERGVIVSEAAESTCGKKN